MNTRVASTRRLGCTECGGVAALDRAKKELSAA
jgi:hypothetical protein